MYIGITLAFYEEKADSVFGILKSLVVDAKKSNVVNVANTLGNKIADYYDCNYLGINDVFFVSGEPKVGEILGRTSYYDYNVISKARKLKSEFPNIETGKFLSTLIYFCSNDIGEKFTLTVLTILELTKSNFEAQIEQIVNDTKLKNKIIEISVDGIKTIDLVGIENLEKTDLKFNVFETLYSDFDSSDDLAEEILSSDDLAEIINDVFPR